MKRQQLINKNGYLLKFLIIFIVFSTIFACENNPIDNPEELIEEDDTLNKSSKGYGDDVITLKKGIQRKKGGKCRPTKGFTKTPIKNLNKKSYRLKFDVKFDKSFDFDRGGKVGYGLKIGDGITGCRSNDSRNNKGGSFRIMWRGIGDENKNISRCEFDKKTTTSGKLIPYIYHKDMDNRCGESFGKEYKIKRDKWYTVVMEFKANSSKKRNGKAILRIGESGKSLTKVLDRNINWSNNSKKRNVSSVIYHFFRGGSDSNWASHKDGKIRIRKVKLGY